MSNQWLRTCSGFPVGGTRLLAEYRRGQQNSALHLRVLNPALKPVFGADLIPDSVNLYTQQAIALPDPAVCDLDNGSWWFSPVILDERACGVIARKTTTGSSDFLEVFASRRLVTELGLSEGTSVPIRILSGRHLFEQPNGEL